jgi:hypothetical protein|tara:strand:+ start:47 stop:238 length:192 start_codon:yes stop_codon:yes gene_type:complete
MYTPLELQKLCSNAIVEQIYTENYYTFTSNLKTFGFPDPINEIIIDRYKVIKNILNYDLKILK